MCWFGAPKIPKADRDIFKRFGEDIIRGTILGMLGPEPPQELHDIYADKESKKQYAIQWLTERANSHERRELRLEIVEWFIVFFVAVDAVRPLQQAWNWLVHL